MDCATPSRSIAHRAAHKSWMWVWSTSDDRRRLLTALGHVHRSRPVFNNTFFRFEKNAFLTFFERWQKFSLQSSGNWKFTCIYLHIMTVNAALFPYSTSDNTPCIMSLFYSLIQPRHSVIWPVVSCSSSATDDWGWPLTSRAGHIYTAAADSEAEDNWPLPASVSSYILIWPTRHSGHWSGPPFIKAGTVPPRRFAGWNAETTQRPSEQLKMQDRKMQDKKMMEKNFFDRLNSAQSQRQRICAVLNDWLLWCWGWAKFSRRIP